MMLCEKRKKTRNLLIATPSFLVFALLLHWQPQCLDHDFYTIMGIISDVCSASGNEENMLAEYGGPKLGRT